MIAKASMSGKAHDSLKYHDFCAFVNRHVFWLLFFFIRRIRTLYPASDAGASD